MYTVCRFIIIGLLFLGNTAIYCNTRAIQDMYHRGKFEPAQQLLEGRQVHSPFDPKLNYNVGLAYYQQKKYAESISSFKRVLHGCEQSERLYQDGLFNLGNAHYKQALSNLGEEWERRFCEQSVLEQAEREAAQSLESYEMLLKLQQEHEPAMINREHAQALLEKIRQKMQQQEQDQQESSGQDNQDNKEDNKHEQSEQNQQQSGDSAQDSSKQQDQQEQDSSGQDNQDNKENNEQEQSGQKSGRQENQQGQSGTEKSGTDQMQQQALQGVLDSLNKKEEGLQKALIRLKTHGDPARPGQRNW